MPRASPSARSPRRVASMRKTVRSWVRTETLPLDQRGYRGAGKIDPYIPYLQTRLAEGCTNQSRLWREIQAQGFTGTRSLVAKWIHAHGQHTPVAPPADGSTAARRPPTRLAHLAGRRAAHGGRAGAVGHASSSMPSCSRWQRWCSQGTSDDPPAAG